MLDGLDHVFVGAYHHQPAIAAKLDADGFRGTVWSTDPRRPGIERVR